MNRNRLLAPWLLLIFAAGCATTAPKTEQVEGPATKRQQEWAQAAAAAPMAKRYKRKIAITRFTNETNYGRSLMTDEDYDRLGKQVSDMLASRLVKSGNFMVFERSDAAKLQREQAVSGGKMVGVDTVIVGSLTEFGRSIGGKTGFSALPRPRSRGPRSTSGWWTSAQGGPFSQRPAPGKPAPNPGRSPGMAATQNTTPP
jgi:curli biogenesis system outer membrane secretion channel CsgG